MSEAIVAANLSGLSGLRHGFFTSAWGDCGLASNTIVLNNRRRVAEHLGVSGENLLSCHQTHSADVVTVAEAWNPALCPSGDAMVTIKPGLALGVLTADCVPILFADPSAGVIGACHAGWRGALAGIIDNTIKAMEKLGARRSGIHAALGPCIWQGSYEVGMEFPEPFLAEDPLNVTFFRAALRRDHLKFNLPGYVEEKLQRIGVGSVAPSQADTCADEARFFSHRRSTSRDEIRGGSMISAIVLAE